MRTAPHDLGNIVHLTEQQSGRGEDGEAIRGGGLLLSGLGGEQQTQQLLEKVRPRRRVPLQKYRSISIPEAWCRGTKSLGDQTHEIVKN